MKYHIWSIEHGKWWRPNMLGYTPFITEAGVYEEEAAKEICFDGNLNTKHTPNEAMVPIKEREGK